MTRSFCLSCMGGNAPRRSVACTAQDVLISRSFSSKPAQLRFATFEQLRLLRKSERDAAFFRALAANDQEQTAATVSQLTLWAT
jgi:hypothetical protein